MWASNRTERWGPRSALGSELVSWARGSCFVTIHVVQPFDTNDQEFERSTEPQPFVDAGSVDHFPSGTCKTISLPDGHELALYNVDGEFYATTNFCPHKGAPLADGSLCGHVIECGLHGWQFDVRTGECLTVRETIKTYPLKIEDGVISVELD